MVFGLLSACAALPSPQESDAAVAVPAGEPRWWIVRIRMGYEDPAEVSWHLDALLAECNPWYVKLFEHAIRASSAQ